MTLEIQVLAQDRHSNVAALNRLMPTLPLTIRSSMAIQLDIGNNKTCTDSLPLKQKL